MGRQDGALGGEVAAGVSQGRLRRCTEVLADGMARVAGAAAAGSSRGGALVCRRNCVTVRKENTVMFEITYQDRMRW